MRTAIAFSLLALLGLASTVGTAQARADRQDILEVCPLDLPGTDAKASITADGVLVTMETTVPSAVAELRERVASIADLVNRNAAQPAGRRSPVLFTATYQESTTGARLLLKPKDPANLEKLQTTMVAQIEAMNRTKRCYHVANI